MGKCQQGQTRQLVPEREVGDGAITFCIRVGVLENQHASEAAAPASSQRPPGQQHEGHGGKQRTCHQQRLESPIAPEGPEPLEPEAKFREPLIGKFRQANHQPRQQQGQGPADCLAKRLRMARERRGGHALMSTRV